MSKRKLVEISPAQHRKLASLRAKLKSRGLSVPTIPYLVQSAIDRGIDKVISEMFPSER